MVPACLMVMRVILKTGVWYVGIMGLHQLQLKASKSKLM